MNDDASGRDGGEAMLKSEAFDAVQQIVALLRTMDVPSRRFVLRAAASRLDVHQPEPDPTGKLARLSMRERQVFEFLVQGRRNREIARALCISTKTVETHREHILKKLGVHSSLHLVRLAAVAGIFRAADRELHGSASTQTTATREAT